MTSIAERLARVRGDLEQACAAAGRPATAVTLVAVGKGFGVEALRAAVDAGQRDLGESYVQEAVPKIRAFAAVPRGRVTWHYIGPLQSNKTRDIAEHFDWVHGIDREKIARRLSEQRPASLPPLQVCVQVNISGEASKSGVAPADAAALCRTVATLPQLKLRGLMAIPAPVKDGERTKHGDRPRAPYRRLRELFESIRAQGLDLDTLSAGMSDDYADAIAEGSTMVRIGTAIYGSRPT